MTTEIYKVPTDAKYNRTWRRCYV